MRKKRKPVKSRLHAASDVLQSLLQNGKSPLAQQFERWRLWSRWGDVVGPTMAKNTTPVAYLKGTLYIWVSDSVRLQEFTFMNREVIKKINKFAGKKWVHSVRFTLDRKSVPKSAETDEDWRDYLSKSPPNGGEKPPRGQ